MKLTKYTSLLACSLMLLTMLFSICNLPAEEAEPKEEEIKKTVIEVTFSTPPQIAALQGRIGLINLARQAEQLEPLKEQVEKAKAETEKQITQINSDLQKAVSDIDNNLIDIKGLLARRFALHTQLDDLSGKNNAKYGDIVSRIERISKDFAAFKSSERKKLVTSRLQSFFGDAIKFKVEAKVFYKKDGATNKQVEDNSIITATLFTQDKAEINPAMELLQAIGKSELRLKHRKLTPTENKFKYVLGYRILWNKSKNTPAYFADPPSQVLSGNVKKAQIQKETRGTITIGIQISAKATKEFAALTTANTNRSLGIFVGTDCIVAPVIKNPIAGGRIIISGNFSSMQEARKIKAMLLTQSFPASVITRIID